MIGQEDFPKWAALLGTPDTKRTIYFEHAAREIGLHVLFIDWNRWKEGFWEKWLLEHHTQGLIKIDPPSSGSADLREAEKLTNAYRKNLGKLAELKKNSPLSFFNEPEKIAALLDKKLCKEKLVQAGLSVTEKVTDERIRCAEELLALMDSKRIVQVFIKPVNGSGAVGVCAFRRHPKTGRMVLYTCAAESGISHCLVNTKRLRRLTENKEIYSFFHHLFKMDCIVEHWHPKADYRGYFYDLRVVLQEGHMDFVLARLSKGPITNLHLNNHPLPVGELGLSGKVLSSVEELCQKAVHCFPGIRSVGLDILLEKGSLTPRIIEMNGQGDLIYQDIYEENQIYLHQARMIKAWMEK